jgi:hypothetical protein
MPAWVSAADRTSAGGVEETLDITSGSDGGFSVGVGETIGGVGSGGGAEIAGGRIGGGS